MSKPPLPFLGPRFLGVALSLLALPLAACGPDAESVSLNAAIRASRDKTRKDELVVVRTIAKERRSEANGIYSFFDAEEPSGRPFVVQTSQKLLYNREYLLRGRIVPHRRGVGGDGPMFVAEGFESSPLWPWFLGLGILAAGSLAGYVYKEPLGVLAKRYLSPVKVPEDTVPGPSPDGGFGVAEASKVPSLSLHPDSPPDVSLFSRFHLAFDENRQIWDNDKGQNCTVYSFGRLPDQNDFALKAPYVGRVAHFRVTVYDDNGAFLEMNPEAKTRVALKSATGGALPLAPDHPQRLEDGCTVTIGEIVLEYRAPTV